jgi:hypothetical protein
MKGYTFIGANEKGESIFYCPADKTIVIEKDYRHVVVPTPEEMEEIYKEFPTLKQSGQ